jgi:hypothetical protein
MNITATRFATQIRTWLLIAAIPERIRRLRVLDREPVVRLAA